MNLHEKFEPTIYRDIISLGGGERVYVPGLGETKQVTKQAKEKTIIPVGGLQDLHDAIDSYRTFVSEEPEANQHNYQRQEELRENITGTSIDRIIRREEHAPHSHADHLQDHINSWLLGRMDDDHLAFVQNHQDKLYAGTHQGFVMELEQGVRDHGIQTLLESNHNTDQARPHVLDAASYNDVLYILTTKGICTPRALNHGQKLTKELKRGSTTPYKSFVRTEKDLLVRSGDKQHYHFSLEAKKPLNTPEIMELEEQPRTFEYRNQVYNWDALGNIERVADRVDYAYVHTDNYAHFLETGSLDLERAQGGGA